MDSIFQKIVVHSFLNNSCLMQDFYSLSNLCFTIYVLISTHVRGATGDCSNFKIKYLEKGRFNIKNFLCTYMDVPFIIIIIVIIITNTFII